MTRALRSSRWCFAAGDADGLLRHLDDLLSTGTAERDELPFGRTDVVIGAGPVRLGIVDPDDRKVRLARRLVAVGKRWNGRSDIWFTPAGIAASRGGDARVAFLYPGVEPAAGNDVIDLAELGRALHIEAPDIRYDTVAHQGASIFQVGLFLDAALRSSGVEPDVAAGHSVGEWAAAVAVGMIREGDATGFLRSFDLHGLVLPELDFVAVAASAEVVGECIGDLDDVVISHDNCPTQTIICGTSEGTDLVLTRLRSRRLMVHKLPFQSGFHTPAIAVALPTIRQMVSGLTIGPGRIPIWSATLAAPYPDDSDDIRELHLRHLVEPVRFRELIEGLYHDAGARIFVQVGLGSLASFADETLRGLDHAAVEVLSDRRSALAQLFRALTALWVEGLDVRIERLLASAA